MLTETLNETKESIKDRLTTKGLYDRFASTILMRIEPNSTMVIYCHRCKGLNKLDFIQFDANLMMHCNGCDIDVMDLDSELYSLVHYNCIKKRGESYD